jgi:hypothetical protein
LFWIHFCLDQIKVFDWAHPCYHFHPSYVDLCISNAAEYSVTVLFAIFGLQKYQNNFQIIASIPTI